MSDQNLSIHEKRLLALALKEDLGRGDQTSLALFSKKNPIVRARIFAKEPIVLSGIKMARVAFESLFPKIEFKKIEQDGSVLEAGKTILEISGPAKEILGAERVALNFLQHLSGVATFTRRFVEKIRGTSAQILDTRKTLPGWRSLEKEAVRAGGALNHRFGLFDAYLIKDNHLALYGAISTAIEAIKKHNRKKLKIEVEIERLEDLEEAISAGADWILLDNMPLEDLRLAVIQNKKRVKLEASGNVNLDNVRAVAQTGVDFISIGALTHSAPAVDLSLEIF